MDKNNGVKDSTSQPSVNDVNKIIKLKTPGVRRVQMKLDFNEKRAAITASLISVIALVTFLNQKIASHFESRSSARSIASIDGNAEYGFHWQKELAQKLAAKSQRSIASYGEAPNKLDQVRFGLLEGKYAFRFENNKISEIEFLPADKDKAKYIGNYETFLLENKEALMPELSQVKKIDSKEEADHKEQTFEALNDSKQELGRFVVISDKDGRFLSMKFIKL